MRLAKQLTLSWVANAVTLGVVTAVLSGVKVDTAGDLIRAALLFGILNTILKPFIRLLTLPLAVITLGLIWFGVAMLMLWLTAVLIDGFSIHGFADALLGDRDRLGRERRARLRARSVARNAPRLRRQKSPCKLACFFGLRPDRSGTRRGSKRG